MILGTTGTSKGMTLQQRLSVEGLFNDLHLTVLHHGDCVGSDAQAHDLAKAIHAYIVVHPPLDKRKRAFCSGDNVLSAFEFLTRNKHIVRDSPGGLIATPRQFREVLRSGTWMTVRYAVSLGRTVWIVNPDGSVNRIDPVKNRNAFSER